MPAKNHVVLEALKSQLETYFTDTWAGDTVNVLRNVTVPETVPGGGLIAINDGDEGDPDRLAGDFGSVFITHAVEIVVYVQDDDRETRDERMSDICAAIGAALVADKTLGGEVNGMLIDPPAALVEEVEGAADVKASEIIAFIDYEKTSSLS